MQEIAAGGRRRHLGELAGFAVQCVIVAAGILPGNFRSREILAALASTVCLS